MSNKEAWGRAKKVKLDAKLVEMCESKGRKRGGGGEVKKIYVTKSGPGPIVLDDSEGLIDSETGLNKFQPGGNGEAFSSSMVLKHLCIGWGLAALAGFALKELHRKKA